jgi:hypothetical protein
MKRPIFVGIVLSIAAVVSGLALSTASSVAATSLPTLTLALTKNTVTVGGGSMVSGAVNVVTTVTGEKSDTPILILLKPGVTPAEFGKVIASLSPTAPFDAIDPYGTVVFDGFAAAGAPSSGQTVLEPGTYVAGETGNGHAVFTVTRAATPAALPTPGATVTAVDFRFRGARTLHDGELVRFQNDGYLIHMFVYIPVKSVVAAKKAEAALLAGNTKTAKKYAIGKPGTFVEPLSHGQLQQEVITQPPGVYVMACFMNAQDGREHFQLGMMRTIKIVK